MKIVTLMENTSCREDLCCEHGLSLYLETENRKILFDAGQSAAFADNAEKMGVDLSQVDLAILSHGHYDHSGGLRRFLEINYRSKIYVNQYAFDCCWHGEDHYIGVDPKLRECDRVMTAGETLRLGEGLTLFACNEKEKSHPADSFGLTVLEDGIFRPDGFRHEQYLLVEEGQKRILFSGCSHKGILNIVQWFHPDVLVGGFHFMKLDPERDAAVLEKAAMELLQYPTTYYTGHCTGEAPFAFLKERMGERLHAVHSGTMIEI
jgi:7,8-dihydropterin-6-yl-methyl-4-(beta-D-ribofuranosyl)aminobenzene 5'-phosphate synthase